MGFLDPNHFTAGPHASTTPGRSSLYTQPERRLAAAVVLNALESIANGAKAGATAGERAEAAQALHWVEAGRTGAPFDFIEACGLLGLRPELGRVAARERAGGQVLSGCL